MTNDDFTRRSLPIGHRMRYNLLPEAVKRRCQALKRIALEQADLERRYRRERIRIGTVMSAPQPEHMDSDDDEPEEPGAELDEHHGPRTDDDKDSDDFRISCPFSARNPLAVVAKRADQLKAIALNHLPLTSRQCYSQVRLVSARASEIRSAVAELEGLCNRILTQLANIDWQLNEYETSLREYHRGVQSSLATYNSRLSELYERRLAIVLGHHEPTDHELGVTIPDTTGEFVELLIAGPAHPRDAGAAPRGVPDFWFEALYVALEGVGVVGPADRGPLSYLADVRYYYDTEFEQPGAGQLTPEVAATWAPNSAHRSQLLLFYFDKNPHFTNRILSKTLYVDKSRQSGRQMFDGLWVTRKEGCIINWTTNEQAAAAPGSFFGFFRERGFGDTLRVRRRTSAGLEVETELDYDVFARFRDFIVPYAVLAFSRGLLVAREDTAAGSRLRYYLDALFGERT